MRCPHCNAENIAGADECQACGHDLTYLNAPTPSEPMERSLMEDPIRVIPLDGPAAVSLDTKLADVVALLVKRNVGAALVMHEGALLGIFSERDLLTKVGDQFEKLKNEPIRRFMTPDPESLDADDPIAFALNRMDVGHFRHLPITENGVPIGLLSVRRILKHLAQRYQDVLMT